MFGLFYKILEIAKKKEKKVKKNHNQWQILKQKDLIKINTVMSKKSGLTNKKVSEKSVVEDVNRYKNNAEYQQR